MVAARPRKESTIELPVYTQLAASYCELAERHGIAREKLLANSGLRAEQLAQPEHAIGFETLKRVARRAQAELRRPSAGIEQGLLLSIRSFGFLGYAALSSPTLGAALDLLIGYYRPYAVVDVSVRVDADAVTVQFDERDPWDELLPLAMDSTIVNFHKVLGELAGDISPVVIRLAHAEQEHHRVLRQMVRGALHFRCGSNQYSFSAAALRRPIQSADPALLKLAIVQCERELQRVADESSILRRVRSRVVARLRAGASLEHVASDLRMTSRTLRRRMASAGCTYHEVVEEVRRTLAIDQLVSSARTAEQIAELLGYRDAANFRRAFRRWTGRSPAEYRSESLELSTAECGRD